jgi:hypothetical protein
VSTVTASYPLAAELYRAGVRMRLRRVAFRLLLLYAIGAAAGIQLLVTGEPTWASELATIMFTICAVAVAMLLTVYARSRRAEAEWLKRVGGGTATLSMDDEGLGIEIPDQRSWCAGTRCAMCGAGATCGCSTSGARTMRSSFRRVPSTVPGLRSRVRRLPQRARAYETCEALS